MKQDQVADFLKDLEYIKSAVKRSQPVLREISEAGQYRSLILTIGIVGTLVPLAFQSLIWGYGSFAAIPSVGKQALWVLVVAGTGLSFLWKWLSLRRRVAQVDSRFTVGSLFKGYLLSYVLHIYLPIVLLGLGLCIYLASTGHSYLIIGAAAITVGLITNSLGVVVQMAEYYFMGYWLLATALLSFLFPGLSGGVWAAISYGGSCFSCLVAIEIIKKRKRAERDGKE